MISPPQSEMVSGPVKDDRRGTTLEIRPTFETGRTGRFPTQAVVVTTAARRMIELSKAGQKLQSVTVRAGDDDPTLHPDFKEISENLRELTKKWFPRAQMVLEASPLYLQDAEVRHAISCYDRPVLRFASGTQKCFKAVTGAKPQALKEVVENLSRLEHEHLVIEARFTRGDVDNSTDSELKAWIGHLAKVKPSTIQIWTPAKATTDGGKKTRPVTKSRMKAIADQITDKTGIPVEILE